MGWDWRISRMPRRRKGRRGVDEGSSEPRSAVVEGGGAFVFTSLSPSGKHVLAADYNSGRVVVYPVASDGKLGAAVRLSPPLSSRVSRSCGFTRCSAFGDYLAMPPVAIERSVFFEKPLHGQR